MTAPMRQPTAATSVEKAAGKRADFIVFYRRNGKPYLDAMWASSAQDAERKLVAFCKELRWKVTVESVEPRVPGP